MAALSSSHVGLGYAVVIKVAGAGSQGLLFYSMTKLQGSSKSSQRRQNQEGGRDFQDVPQHFIFG